MERNFEEYPEVVLILGKTGVGRAAFIQAATGLDVKIGNSLKSCKPSPSLCHRPSARWDTVKVQLRYRYTRCYGYILYRGQRGLHLRDSYPIETSAGTLAGLLLTRLAIIALFASYFLLLCLGLKTDKCFLLLCSESWRPRDARFPPLAWAKDWQLLWRHSCREGTGLYSMQRLLLGVSLM